VDLAYAPPPAPPRLSTLSEFPPPPIASTDTNDPKSLGILNVELPCVVMNTIFCVSLYVNTMIP
jgi:hypothetical protein